MFDIVSSLNQLSTSKHDLEKIDEELSKVMDNSNDEIGKKKTKKVKSSKQLEVDYKTNDRSG